MHPNQGSNPKPGHVPGPGSKLATFQCTGRRSTAGATPARARCGLLCLEKKDTKFQVRAPFPPSSSWSDIKGIAKTTPHHGSSPKHRTSFAHECAFQLTGLSAQPWQGKVSYEQETLGVRPVGEVHWVRIYTQTSNPVRQQSVEILRTCLNFCQLP